MVHAALDDGALDAEQFGDSGLHGASFEVKVAACSRVALDVTKRDRASQVKLGLISTVAPVARGLKAWMTSSCSTQVRDNRERASDTRPDAQSIVRSASMAICSPCS